MPMRNHAALAIAAIATLLVGCGPRYQTYTSYAPPQDDVGRQCLAQCLTSRQLCRQSTQVQIQQCRLGAQTEAQIENLRRLAEYQASLEHHGAGLNRKAPERPGTVGPNYSQCNGVAAAADRQCAADHDLCYQNCGGVVTYATHCVANCEG